MLSKIESPNICFPKSRTFSFSILDMPLYMADNNSLRLSLFKEILSEV
jgi:hypothetical protein